MYIKQHIDISNPTLSPPPRCLPILPFFSPLSLSFRYLPFCFPPLLHIDQDQTLFLVHLFRFVPPPFISPFFLSLLSPLLSLILTNFNLFVVKMFPPLSSHAHPSLRSKHRKVCWLILFFLLSPHFPLFSFAPLYPIYLYACKQSISFPFHR